MTGPPLLVVAGIHVWRLFVEASPSRRSVAGFTGVCLGLIAMVSVNSVSAMRAADERAEALRLAQRLLPIVDRFDTSDDDPATGPFAAIDPFGGVESIRGGMEMMTELGWRELTPLRDVGPGETTREFDSVVRLDYRGETKPVENDRAKRLA